MGRKKRAAASKRSPKPLSTAVLDSPSLVPESKLEAESDQLTIKEECEKALDVLCRGNHSKALRMMKETSLKFENSALVHRVIGTCYTNVAGIIDDPTVRERHLQNAIGSAKKAVSFSPNSIEFAHFYANLLYDMAYSCQDYEDVVKECERALEIENPIDPVKENLLLQPREPEDKMLESCANACSEYRICQFQDELRSLIQKSNIASISNWMEHLGGVAWDEKYRLIPLRRLSDDPLEVRYLQITGSPAHNPDEVKKLTKTPEERRMEIEVSVAAARLLQQKSEQASSGGGNTSVSMGSDASKIGERRRHGNSRRNAAISERKDHVRSFWNSMNSEMKRDLLSFNVSDIIRVHISSNKEGSQANEILSEALTFFEVHRTWRFWACFRCGERFPYAETHLQHVVQEHMKDPLPKLRPLLPYNVNSQWAEMLVTCFWKPLDLEASVSLLEDQSRHDDSEFSGRVNLKERMDDIVLNSESKTCETDRGSKVFNLPNSWPLSDDTERANLLERISCMFQLLITHKCLATSHLGKVIQFTMEELQGSSQILCHCVDQTPMCIWFLGASQLKEILKFLQELCLATGVGRSPKKISPDDSSSHPPISGCDDKILLEDDASCLLLVDSLLSCNGVSDGVGLESLVGSEKGIQYGSDFLLSWIYADPTSGEQFATWSRFKKEKSHEGMELLDNFEKEIVSLQKLYDKKCEHSGFEEALEGLEELYLEERKKREHATEFSGSCYALILRRRRDELIQDENKDKNSLEVKVISNILKEVQNINVNQFGFDETYGEVTTILHDLEAGDDDWKSKDYRHLIDTCLETATQMQREQVSLELSKIDAKMLQSITNMKQLELKLEPVSAFDYRNIVLPVIKSYLQAQLEDLVEKDATEKSDAAREAFLAELDLESKKGARTGNDKFKNMQEKVKDKRRNKDFRRNRDSKAGSFKKQFEATEQPSVVTVTFGDDEMDTEIVVSKRIEELGRRKTDFEADGIKLEETMEYQRQVENEAKQKLLAEHQRNALVASESVLEESDDEGMPFELVTTRKGKRRSSTRVSEERYKAVSYGKENANVGKKLEETLEYQRQLENEAKQKLLAEHRRNALVASESVLEKSDDEGMPFEQQTTRKGKWRSSTRVSEGRDQVVSYGKENANVGKKLEETLEYHRRLENEAKQKLLAERRRNALVASESVLEESDDEGMPFEQQTTRKGEWRSSTRVTEERYQAVSYGKENANVKCSSGDLMQRDQVLNQDGVSHSVGDGGSKTLRQLQDEEDIFQADLKKAVRQSLATFQAHHKLPSKTRVTVEISIEMEKSAIKTSEVMIEDVGELNVVGAGLQNQAGEYNCFLNVIIQSLWHLRRFREDFLRRSVSKHVHVGDPCVVCALYDILTALNMAFDDATNREPVASTALRIALSKLYPKSNFFQEGQMNDASEVLAVLFDCLHQSFTSGSTGSVCELLESNCLGSYDCTNQSCIAHSLFGMDIFERMNCYSCGLESRHLKYTSFFHYINASALRTMKVKCVESSFEKLLHFVEMNHQLACDPEVGGCGKLNHIHHILSKPPYVFTTVLGWQNACESIEDIKATLAALTTEIDISVLYHGLDPKNMHSLVSVVCYYGQHYHCFAYSCEYEKWIMYNDQVVKVIGSWEEVLSMCERGHLQPQLLFYDTVN